MSVSRVFPAAIAPLLLGLFLSPAVLQAQQKCPPGRVCTNMAPPPGGDTQPPDISISPSGGTFGAASLSVTITWTDNQYLYAVSRSITLNGGNVTSSFSWSASSNTHATSTGTITLQPGSNTLTAHICDTSSNCRNVSAYYTLSYTPPAVTPDGSAASASANSSGHTASFTVTNSNSDTITYSFTCAHTGKVTSCSPPGSVPVAANSSRSVTAMYGTGAPGTGTLTVTATGGGSSDNGYYNITVSPPDTAQNSAFLDRSKCVAGCFDASLSYSTPAYYSMDTPRSATLVYTSAQAHPMGFVQIDARDDSVVKPTKMAIRLRRPDGSFVTFTNGNSYVYYSYPSSGGTIRLAAQFDASSLATGAYAYDVLVEKYWPDRVKENAPVPVNVLIDNEGSSVFGHGWSLGGLQHLYVQSDGVVIADGAGSVAYFAANGSTFLTPDGDYSTLTHGTGSYTRSYPDGTSVVFFGDGRVNYVQDRFGNRSTYNYDASNRLSSISDPAGKSLTFAYDLNGKLASITDPGGRVSTFYVSGSTGDLTSIQDPGGAYALQMFFDPSTHRVTQYTDRRGGVWNVTYDAVGKIASHVAPAVPISGQGNVRPTQHFGSYELAVLPASGQGTSTSPAPARIPADLRASTTTPRGFTTHYALDRYGAATRIEEPLGRTTVVLRDSLSRVYESISPSGDSVDFTWSGADLVQTYDRSTGRDIHRSYTVDYHEVSHVYGDVPEALYYWSAGKLDSAKVGGHTSTYTYDTHGRVLTADDGSPAGNSRFVYDRTNSWMNVDTTYTPTEPTAARQYDGYGRPVYESMSGSLVYDALNRVTKSIGLAGDTTIYHYDALFLTQLTDATHQTFSVVPNALGWAESRTGPAGAAQDLFEYDLDGNAVKWTNRRGQVVTSTYDDLDQLASRTADGKTATFHTDPLGRFATAANAEATDSLVYDVAGRVVHQYQTLSGVRHDVSWTYDVRGQPHDGSVLGSNTSRSLGYRFDAATGQLDQILGLNSAWTTLQHPTADSTVNSLGNGVVANTSGISGNATMNIGYNFSRVDSMFGAHYAYNGFKDMYQRQNAIRDTIRDYSYDAHRFLVGVQDSYEPTPHNCYVDGDQIVCPPLDSTGVFYTKSYTYDDVGNRTDLGAVVQAGDRLTSFNGLTLEYDADGNLTRKYKAGVVDQRFYWNSLGQLDSVTNNGSTVVTFGYDGFGRRVRKGSSWWVHDGANAVREVDASGNTLADYNYYPGVDMPHSVRHGGGSAPIYYYVLDASANVVGTLDSSGGLASHRGYMPFGTLEYDREWTSTPDALGFAASYRDTETGLYYMRARYYDPDLARFISEDPIGLAGGINPYVYAGNNPLTHRDPGGLTQEAPFCLWYIYAPDSDAPGIFVGSCWASLMGRLTAGLMDRSVDAAIASIGPFAPSGPAPALVALAGGPAGPKKRNVMCTTGGAIVSYGVAALEDLGALAADVAIGEAILDAAPGALLGAGVAAAAKQLGFEGGSTALIAKGLGETVDKGILYTMDSALWGEAPTGWGYVKNELSELVPGSHSWGVYRKRGRICH